MKELSYTENPLKPYLTFFLPHLLLHPPSLALPYIYHCPRQQWRGLTRPLGDAVKGTLRPRYPENSGSSMCVLGQSVSYRVQTMEC